MEQQIQENRKNLSPQWYIWYTKPRAEKKVSERLQAKGVEVFLPLRRELRQWSDRKKWVEAPLFSGYIFTCIDAKQIENVGYTEGILTFVRFEGKPATLRSEQIEDIRLMLGDPELIIEDERIPVGEAIDIIAGPLRGMQAEIVTYRGNNKMAVRIEQLNKVMLVQLPVGYVKRSRRA